MEGESQFIFPEDNEIKRKRQEAISGLQRALILMSHKSAAEWIDANGAAFRRLVDRRPEFLDRFIHDDPELVAQEVRDLMFNED